MSKLKSELANLKMTDKRLLISTLSVPLKSPKNDPFQNYLRVTFFGDEKLYYFTGVFFAIEVDYLFLGDYWGYSIALFSFLA